MQELTPPYDDILEDETLAPLKRNHACLQCKKRKVKCDAVRPTCNPCMRSHAHALRSAQRNKSKPPPLVCTYAEGDEDEWNSRPEVVVDVDRKRSSAAAPAGKRAAVGDKLAREKERRALEDKETLRARIAELEARIASLTTNPTAQTASQSYTKQATVSDGNWDLPMSTFAVPQPQIDYTPSVQPPMVSIEAGQPGTFQSFDFSNLLMLPSKWPKNLPSPAVLEHLVETFFQYEPQLNRMVHRPTLLQRISMGPGHDDFPFPGLLHAICAAAAPHTAWITTLKPEQLESTSIRHIEAGLDLEACEDFAIAQTEAAERCMRHSTVLCMMGTGKFIFDLARAQMIISATYFNKGMALRSWMSSGTPIRLIKALEISNRNPRKLGEKPALIGAAENDSDREERLATIWLSYLNEAGFAANSAWAPNLELQDIRVPLPTSAEEFAQKVDRSGYMKQNPQTGHDPDILVNHPMPDPFVLVMKCSIILGKVAKWIREWQQREIKPGDEMEGFRSPEFMKLNAEIAGFQLSIPSTFKNIYKMADAGKNAVFNANLLSIHLLPNLATLLLHEQFVDWKGAETPSHRQMQKAFEAVVGFIHLIPSQLDVSLLMNPLLAFSLFSIGKSVNRFIIRATEMEQYAHAMRWRTDLQAINDLLARYGEKHALGLHLLGYLSSFQRLYEEGKIVGECHQLDGNRGARCYASSMGDSDAAEIVEASIRSTGSNSSPNVLSSVGHTPESIDAVDSQTPAHCVINGLGQMPGQTGNMGMDSTLNMNGMNGMNGVSGYSSSSKSTSPPTTNTSPGFDTSLLDFLDPSAAAQFAAALNSAGMSGMSNMMDMGMGMGLNGAGTETTLADLLAAGGQLGSPGDNFPWNARQMQQ